MIKYRFTYDIVTFESALEGDVAESGFYSPPGCAGGHFDVAGEGNGDYHEVRASKALRDIQNAVGRGGCVEVYGTCLTVQGHAEEDHRTGASETRTAHIVAHPRLIRALAKRFRASV